MTEFLTVFDKENNKSLQRIFQKFEVKYLGFGTVMCYKFSVKNFS